MKVLLLFLLIFSFLNASLDFKKLPSNDLIEMYFSASDNDKEKIEKELKDRNNENEFEKLSTPDLFQLLKTANSKDKKEIQAVINGRKLNLTREEREKLKDDNGTIDYDKYNSFHRHQLKLENTKILK